MSTPLALPVLDWALPDMRRTLGLPPSPDDAGLIGRRIVTDSRQVQAGDVFIALRGERFDAHDFVPDVLARGAVAAIVERSLDVQGPVWQVADTREALGCLARAWRARHAIGVIAVTGSNGKTTTKEMIASILRAHFGASAVLSTRGNLNNEIGVPNTLLELHAAHRVAVIEMGMNHPGEIARLASWVMPSVALVNNAQREHQEFMKTVEAVARENGSVIAALPADGVAVYPSDDAHAAVWDELAGSRRTLRFAMQGTSDAQACAAGSMPAVVSAQQHNGQLRLQMSGPWIERLSLTLNMPGEHNARNALAAALCAWAAGCSAASIVKGLESFEAVSGRMQRMPHPSGGVLINDSYNANPDSVEAAIHALAALSAPRCLVLGDMGEVGEQGESFHRELGYLARAAGIEQLHTVGQLARFSTEAFGSGAQHHPDMDSLTKTMTHLADKQAGSILVKGSRFMKMETVVQAICAQRTGGSSHVA